MKKPLPTLLALGLLCATPALAQFTGPSATGDALTIEAAGDLPVGTYVTLTGRIVEHLREEYYSFADDTGSMRVEIPADRWRGNAVSPETTVRLVGELDRSLAGRYLWVRSLDIVD
jgi:uncharacterized protein (TIGR00156 family)